MTARDGMIDIIARLRTMTSANEGDTVLNGVSYWTDDQLQDVLDEHGVSLRRARLDIETSYIGGTPVYRDFYLPLPTTNNVETGDAFQIQTSNGDVVDALTYTFDVNQKRVTFASNPPSNELYVYAVHYPLDEVAADIWLRKAGLRYDLIEWKAGPTSMKEDKEYLHCLEMAKRFSSKNGIKGVRLYRLGYNNGI